MVGIWNKSVNYTVTIVLVDIIILVICACYLVLVSVIVMVANSCFSCKAVVPSMQLSRLN